MAQAGPWKMLAADGALWTKQVPKNVSSGLVLDDDGVVYVACRDARLYRYQAQSGSSEPTYNNRSQITSYTPAMANGLIYLGAGRQFSAVDMTTLTSIWTYSNVGAVNSSPVIDTGSGSVIFASTLMFGPQDNKVLSLNSTTGALNWEFPMPSNVLSSPALSGGRVYIGCDAGFVVGLDATSGAQVWRYPTTGRVPGMIRTPPAVDVDRNAVYVATQASPINENQLLALNSNTGELLWSYTPGEYVPRYCCPVLASNGIIYVGFYGLHAVNPNDGSRLWRSSTEGNFGRYPGAAAIGSTNTVYFTTEDAKCLAYNADGTELFRFNGGHSSSPPAIGPGNSLYFADWKKNVFCLQTSAPAPVSTLPDVTPPVVGTVPPPPSTISTDTIWWSQGSPGQF